MFHTYLCLINSYYFGYDLTFSWMSSSFLKKWFNSNSMSARVNIFIRKQDCLDKWSRILSKIYALIGLCVLISLLFLLNSVIYHSVLMVSCGIRTFSTEHLKKTYDYTYFTEIKAWDLLVSTIICFPLSYQDCILCVYRNRFQSIRGFQLQL